MTFKFEIPEMPKNPNGFAFGVGKGNKHRVNIRGVDGKMMFVTVANGFKTREVADEAVASLTAHLDGPEGYIYKLKVLALATNQERETAESQHAATNVRFTTARAIHADTLAKRDTAITMRDALKVDLIYWKRFAWVGILACSAAGFVFGQLA